ncbi:MAG: hypothetical protein HUU06_06765 [Planctomycetaceae bacterium]|nr:hypothetical protein [Planctomycetaceae bacterium]
MNADRGMLVEVTMRPLAAAFLSAACLLLPGRSLAQEGAANLPSEEVARSLFAWFDGLGYPDLRGKPWVRITYRCGGTFAGSPPRETSMCGFLLEENKDSLRILHPSTEEYTFSKGPPTSASSGAAAYVRIDLLTEVKSIVRDYEGQPPPGARDKSLPIPEGFTSWGYPYRVGFFTLARAVDATGEPQWALRLLACYGRERWEGSEEAPTALREQIENDLGDGLLSSTVSGFGIWWILGAPQGRLMPRSELLAACRRIIEKYPGSSVAPRARTMASVLERMVAEDAAHRIPDGFPDACPVDDRAREWVFRLRDQGGMCFCLTHGPPRVLSGPEDSPAHRLVGLGLDAVPSLLAALKDHGPTRAIDNDGGPWSSELLPISGAALQILEEIANRDFSDGAAAEQWWSRVRSDGIEKVLEEAVRTGGIDGGRQAEALARRFPEKALQPILEGLRVKGPPIDRVAYVDAAASIPGDGPVPFLLEELAGGSQLGSRIAAARGLQARGRGEALPAMIREWKECRDGRCPKDLLSFLLKSGSPSAVRTLAEGLADRPDSWRRDVATEAWTFVEAPPDLKPVSGAFREATEDLLASLLQDRAPVGGSRWVLGVDLTDARICDLAGTGLARIRGTASVFDPKAAPGDRDRMLRTTENAWRKDRGLAPLPELPK